jgi:formiminotetrahydrofolate cyclodeaminase
VEAKAVYRESVISALAVPMEIAAAASTALALMEKLTLSANKRLLSDLAAAAVLASASAHAVAYIVRINLPELDEPARRTQFADELQRILAHCELRRAAIETFVSEHLK